MSGLCVEIGLGAFVGGLVWFYRFDRPYKAVLAVVSGAALIGLGFFLAPIDAAIQTGAFKGL